LRWLAAWFWGPVVFLVSDLAFTPFSLLAALLTSVLLTGSVVLPFRLVRREGVFRGLLLASLLGGLAGVVLGLLQAGFWFDEAWEIQGLGAWLLSGMFLPPALWVLSRLMQFGVNAPRNLLRRLRGLRHPAATAPARPAPTSRTGALKKSGGHKNTPAAKEPGDSKKPGKDKNNKGTRASRR
jgi:hypothetical protein